MEGLIMTQGKYGLNLLALALLAFVLSFFGYVEVLVLLLAYAVLAEKDHALTHGTLQALYLRLTYDIARTLIGWLIGLFVKFFDLFSANTVVNAFYRIENVLNGLLYAALLVAFVLAIIQLLKNKACKLPLLSHLADLTMGLVKQKTPAPAAYATPAPAAYSPPPVPPAVSVPPAYATPAPAASVVRSAPIVQAQPDRTVQETSLPQSESAGTTAWICSCGQENTGKFCMKCGQPRP